MSSLLCNAVHSHRPRSHVVLPHRTYTKNKKKHDCTAAPTAADLETTDTDTCITLSTADITDTMYVIASICLLTCMFSTQAHAEQGSHNYSLSSQEGVGPLLKRLFILHSSKLMAVAVFWAAMQQPGAIGWLLTCESTEASLGDTGTSVLANAACWALVTPWLLTQVWQQSMRGCLGCL